MLDTVLSQHVPPTWLPATYDRTFLKVTLGNDDEEYDNVVREFKSMNVENVYRIQNPFIWGRFKLRKEQLQKRQQSVNEFQMYHPIGLEDSDVVAEYNCDYRRYSQKHAFQHANKKPKFYQSPQVVKSLYDEHCMKVSCMVVVRVLHEGIFLGSVVQKDWDTEYVPEYIVKLS